MKITFETALLIYACEPSVNERFLIYSFNLAPARKIPSLIIAWILSRFDVAKQTTRWLQDAQKRAPGGLESIKWRCNLHLSEFEACSQNKQDFFYQIFSKKTPNSSKKRAKKSAILLLFYLKINKLNRISSYFYTARWNGGREWVFGLQ